MKKRHTEALATLGITTESYYVDGWPPVWGIALLRDGREMAVIEAHGQHHESSTYRNKYVLRAKRATTGPETKDEDGYASCPTILAPDIAIYRTQREAIAACVRRHH